MPTIQRATVQVKEIGMPFTSLYSVFRIPKCFPRLLAFTSNLKHLTSNVLILNS
jgi:hypothetical protein